MRPMMRTTKSTSAALVLCASTTSLSDAYVPSSFLASSATTRAAFRKRSSPSINHLNMVYAPPGSGYLDKEDETSVYPDSYDPMMEYPGTMRPGKTKENQAFENLPLADTDPDPVPWPHFQEIEWHHLWEPPHPHSTPMEEFIEQQGRWASAEEEAQMRMEVRRGVRERRELEEMEKSGVTTLIVDTDEDDDEEEEEEPQLELGQGVGDLLGGGDGAKATAADDDDDDDEVEDDEGGDTDFLLDLGLDADDGGADDDDDGGDEIASADDGGADDILDALSGILGGENDEDIATATTAQDGADIDLDIDMDDFDDDDDIDLDGGDGEDVTMVGGDTTDGFDTVPLEDYGESEDMGEEDHFDDGGFDYDEGGDGGGGDMDGW